VVVRVNGIVDSGESSGGAIIPKVSTRASRGFDVGRIMT